MNRTTLYSTTALITVTFASAGVAQAADLTTMDTAPLLEEASLPAVSQVNAKIAAAFGVLDDEFLALGLGSVTFPVGHSFGFQVDGLGAYTGDDDDGAAGLGAHAFWRDPSTGLFGLYGAYTWVGREDPDNVAQIAAEGELYAGNFTVGALAGVGFGDENLNDADFFALVDLSAYLGEDVRLYGGYRYQIDQHMGTLGVEFMPGFASMPGMSVFGEGTVTDEGEYMAFAGLRYYFGPQRSLIRRHREDDPIITSMPPNLLLVGDDDDDACDPEINCPLPPLDPS
jgi:hypothetical protein